MPRAILLNHKNRNNFISTTPTTISFSPVLKYLLKNISPHRIKDIYLDCKAKSGAEFLRKSLLNPKINELIYLFSQRADDEMVMMMMWHLKPPTMTS